MRLNHCWSSKSIACSICECNQPNRSTESTTKHFMQGTDCPLPLWEIAFKVRCWLALGQSYYSEAGVWAFDSTWMCMYMHVYHWCISAYQALHVQSQEREVVGHLLPFCLKYKKLGEMERQVNTYYMHNLPVWSYKFMHKVKLLAS